MNRLAVHPFTALISLACIVLVTSCSPADESPGSSSRSELWPTGLVSPVQGGTFPMLADHLPGAAIDGRPGAHHGFEFSTGYSGRAMPGNMAVVAVAPGEIIRIDREYSSPGDDALDFWADQADSPGFPGSYAMDQLRGRQAWIRHESGHISRYAHLSAVNPELAPGSEVARGQPVGRAGTSGRVRGGEAQPPAARLHYELWSADGTRHLCQEAGPLDCHQQILAIFGAQALPRYAQAVLEQVDEGEPLPDPYPPRELPDTSFSLDPPASMTPGRPFAIPATWDGGVFQPEGFFAQLDGRPLGIINAGNGAWLLGTLPMDFGDPEAELVVGAADSYGRTVVGSRLVDVHSGKNESAAIEVSEAVMMAQSTPDSQRGSQVLVEAGLRSLNSTTPLWSEPFHAPQEGKVTRRFGQEIFHGLLRSAHPLPGVIIEAEPGDTVTASNAGRIAGVVELPVRGNTVVIDHGGGVTSVYAHMAETSVAEGDEVQRGQPLGQAGDSGATDNVQVRWEIHIAGTPTNPVDWHKKTLPNDQPSSSD